MAAIFTSNPMLNLTLADSNTTWKIVGFQKDFSWWGFKLKRIIQPLGAEQFESCKILDHPTLPAFTKTLQDMIKTYKNSFYKSSREFGGRGILNLFSNLTNKLISSLQEGCCSIKETQIALREKQSRYEFLGRRSSSGDGSLNFQLYLSGDRLAPLPRSHP